MELDLKALTNTEPPRICRALLNKLGSEIQMEEFEFELACYALESLNQLKYRSLPMKPTVLWQFEEERKSSGWRSMEGDQRRAISKKVLALPEVTQYWAEYQRKFGENMADAYWLEKYMDIFLKKGDKVFAKRVWDIYKDYPETMETSNGRSWKKKKFQPNSSKSSAGRTARDLQELFGETGGVSPQSTQHKE